MSKGSHDVYEFGPFRLLVGEQVLLREGRSLPLTPKTFNLLVTLIESHGHLVTKDALMQRVWPDTFVQEDNITYNISMLRKALGDGANGERYIETVPRRGYRFVAEVNGISAVGGDGINLRAGGPAASPAPPAALPASAAEAGWDVSQPAAVLAAARVSADTTAADASRAILPQPEAEGAARRAAWRLPAVFAAVLGLVAGLVMAYDLLYPLSPPRILDSQQLTFDQREKIGPIVTDGARVYFEEIVGVRHFAASVAASGTDNSVTLLQTPGLTRTDVSRDHAEHIGLLEGPASDKPAIVTWPAAGGALSSLDGLRGDSPVWSPEGSRLAYGDGRKLSIFDLTGQRPLQAFDVPGQPKGIRWSPNGEVLRFQIGETAGSLPNEIWEAVPGSRRVRSLHLTGEAHWPEGIAAGGNWTPDGRYFVFVALYRSKFEIWARREKCGLRFWRCGQPARVSTEGMNYREVVPSEDGARLFAIGEQMRAETARYDASSGGLTDFLPGIGASQVDFTPNGKWSTYIVLPEHTLWRSRADGSEPLRLAVLPDTFETEQPHWSPDGRMIAFVSRSRRDVRKLCVVSADGGPARELIPDPNSQEGVGTWSPDGRSIIFGEPAVNGTDSGKLLIRVLDLVSNRLFVLPGSAGLWTARWSPDGRFVAALRAGPPDRPGSSSELLLYTWATGKWTSLVRLPLIEDPAWSRDSRYVYFHTLGLDPALYRAGVPDGHLEKLLSLEGIPGARGNWSGVAPDGSPLITRNVFISEIYALDMDWP